MGEGRRDGSRGSRGHWSRPGPVVVAEGPPGGARRHRRDALGWAGLVRSLRDPLRRSRPGARSGGGQSHWGVFEHPHSGGWPEARPSSRSTSTLTSRHRHRVWEPRDARQTCGASRRTEGSPRHVWRKRVGDLGYGPHTVVFSSGRLKFGVQDNLRVGRPRNAHAQASALRSLSLRGHQPEQGDVPFLKSEMRVEGPCLLVRSEDLDMDGPAPGRTEVLIQLG
jgi:hypothetical protein